jgi:UDP-glucose 4-epimerase
MSGGHLMNALVTGGSGFIGSHLVMRLLKEEHNTTVVDYDINFFDENSIKKIHMFQLGAEDSKCERIFADTYFDIVFHLAFHMPTGEINDSETHHMHINQVGLSNILYLSEKYHVPKVIVLSSYQVYGRQESAPINEDAPLRPLDLAGQHQRTREMQCGEYRQRGMDVIILRTGNVYGPRKKAGPGNYIQQQIDEIMACRKTAGLDMEQAAGPDHDADLTAYDYIYINDVVEALFLAAEMEISPILNISSGMGVMRHDIDRFCQLLMNARSDDMGLAGDFTDESVANMLVTTDLSKRPEGMSFVLDNRRAQQELNWAPKRHLNGHLNLKMMLH